MEKRKVEEGGPGVWGGSGQGEPNGDLRQDSEAHEQISQADPWGSTCWEVGRASTKLYWGNSKEASVSEAA